MIRNKSKNKVNTLVAFFAILALCSCQTQMPQKTQVKGSEISYSKNILSTETTKNEKDIKPLPVASASASVIPNISLVSPQQIKDEEEIKTIIEKEIDLSFLNTDDDDSLQATVPNNGGVVFATVPNNGGVVFFTDSDPTTLSTFSTKAILNNQTTVVKTIREEVKETIKENVKEKVKEVKAKRPRLIDIIPEKWGKKVIGKPKKEVKFEFNKENTQANVTVTSTSDIEMRLENKTNPLAKKLQEILKVTAIFIKEGKSWKLSKVSKPESVDAKNEAKIEITSVKMTIVSKDKTSKVINVNLRDLQSKDEFPTLENGDIVTLEVKAINTDSNSDDNLNVFAKLSNAKVRIPLSDDGSQNSISKEKSDTKESSNKTSSDKKETNKKKSGDLVKDDDIYTANIGIKANKGTNYLVITAVTDGSFESSSNFLSISKSIPFNIK